MRSVHGMDVQFALLFAMSLLSKSRMTMRQMIMTRPSQM